MLVLSLCQIPYYGRRFIVAVFVAIFFFLVYFFCDQVLWSSARKSLPNIISVPFFKFPQSHVARSPGGVEVNVRIFRLKPRATQVAEMGIALEADHMVAAHHFLTPSVACWAGGGVQLDVFFRSPLLCAYFVLSPRETNGELSMPARFANLAECKIAILADGQSLARRRQFFNSWFGTRRLHLVFVLGFYIGLCHLAELPFLWVLFGAGCSLTPRSRTIDGGFVGLE